MLRNQVIQCAAVDLLSAIPASTVSAIITDPPFFINVGRQQDWSQAAGFGTDPWTPDISSLDDAIRWTAPHAREALRVLKPGGALVVMGGAQSLAAWEVTTAQLNMPWMAEITVLWNTGKPRARNFGSLSTAIRWYVKPGARHAFNAGDARSIYSNVIVAKKVPPNERLHPAQKPLELTNFLVSLLTNERDLVVDPFAGAGSTLVSAAICSRDYLGSDIEEKYVTVAERRILNHDTEEIEDSDIHLWLNNRLIKIEG